MLPNWLGEPYALLYTSLKGKKFNFDDARRELGSPDELTLKILSEIGKRGFLVSDRKTYYLSRFEDVCLGIKAGKEFENRDIDENLKSSHKDYGKKYLITGSYAAFLYHGYQFPVRHEIKVMKEDYGYWFQALKDSQLIPELTGKDFEGREIVSGLFVEPPERTVIEAIKKGSTSSLLDSTSILMSKKMDWKKLEDLARKEKIVKELGAILEVLEDNIEKNYDECWIPHKTIDGLFSHVGKIRRRKIYPKNVLNPQVTYKQIGEKWGLSLRLPRYVVEKPLEDILPLSLGVVE